MGWGGDRGWRVQAVVHARVVALRAVELAILAVVARHADDAAVAARGAVQAQQRGGCGGEGGWEAEVRRDAVAGLGGVAELDPPDRARQPLRRAELHVQRVRLRPRRQAPVSTITGLQGLRARRMGRGVRRLAVRPSRGRSGPMTSCMASSTDARSVLAVSDILARAAHTAHDPQPALLA